MSQLSKAQFEIILKNAPKGTDPKQLAKEFINRGYELEGLNTNEFKKDIQRQEQVQYFEGNQFEDTPERGFLGKTRDVAANIIGGGKLAEGAGQALSTSDSLLARGVRGATSFAQGEGFNTQGVQGSLSDVQQSSSDTQLALVKRINEKKARGEDTSRLESALKDEQLNSASLADTQTDFTDALKSNKEVLGSAVRLAGTVAAPTIAGKLTGGIGAGTGLVGGAVQGAKIGALGGAIEGGIQGGGLAIEKDGDIFKGVAGGALFGGVAGGVLGGAIGGVTGKLKARKELQDAIRTKMTTNPDSTVARYVMDGQGKIVSDPKAIEAIKQGMDEGTVSLMKGASQTDRAGMTKALDIFEKGKVDRKYRIVNRPSDVIGDSVTSRFSVVKSANEKAAGQLDTVANALKGNSVDMSSPFQAFVDDLTDMGVTFKNGKPIFEGSDIEGVLPAENLIKKVMKRLGSMSEDALDAHKMKKFLDENLNFGKAGEGLTGSTERIVKGFRSNIDGVLDNAFPEYNAVNTAYSTTRSAMDDFLSAAGSKFDINSPNANKQLGTLSRRIMSNAQSRVQVLDQLQSLDEVAKSLGGKFDDDILTQVAFVDELEKMFGSSATTSLGGTFEKTLSGGKKLAQSLRSAESFGGLALDATASGIDKLQGVSEEKLLSSLRELLK